MTKYVCLHSWDRVGRRMHFAQNKILIILSGKENICLELCIFSFNVKYTIRTERLVIGILR